MRNEFPVTSSVKRQTKQEGPETTNRRNNSNFQSDLYNTDYKSQCQSPRKREYRPSDSKATPQPSAADFTTINSGRSLSQPRSNRNPSSPPYLTNHRSTTPLKDHFRNASSSRAKIQERTQMQRRKDIRDHYSADYGPLHDRLSHPQVFPTFLKSQTPMEDVTLMPRESSKPPVYKSIVVFIEEARAKARLNPDESWSAKITVGRTTALRTSGVAATSDDPTLLRWESTMEFPFSSEDFLKVGISGIKSKTSLGTSKIDLRSVIEQNQSSENFWLGLHQKSEDGGEDGACTGHIRVSVNFLMNSCPKPRVVQEIVQRINDRQLSRESFSLAENYSFNANYDRERNANSQNVTKSRSIEKSSSRKNPSGQPLTHAVSADMELFVRPPALPKSSFTVPKKQHNQNINFVLKASTELEPHPPSVRQDYEMDDLDENLPQQTSDQENMLPSENQDSSSHMPFTPSVRSATNISDVARNDDQRSSNSASSSTSIWSGEESQIFRFLNLVKSISVVVQRFIFFPEFLTLNVEPTCVVHLGMVKGKPLEALSFDGNSVQYSTQCIFKYEREKKLKFEIVERERSEILGIASFAVERWLQEESSPAAAVSKKLSIENSSQIEIGLLYITISSSTHQPKGAVSVRRVSDEVLQAGNVFSSNKETRKSQGSKKYADDQSQLLSRNGLYNSAFSNHQKSDHQHLPKNLYPRPPDSPQRKVVPVEGQRETDFASVVVAESSPVPVGVLLTFGPRWIEFNNHTEVPLDHMVEDVCVSVGGNSVINSAPFPYLSLFQNLVDCYLPLPPLGTRGTRRPLRITVTIADEDDQLLYCSINLDPYLRTERKGHYVLVPLSSQRTKATMGLAKFRLNFQNQDLSEPEWRTLGGVFPKSSATSNSHEDDLPPLYYGRNVRASPTSQKAKSNPNPSRNSQGQHLPPENSQMQHQIKTSDDNVREPRLYSLTTQTHQTHHSNKIKQFSHHKNLSLLKNEFYGQSQSPRPMVSTTESTSQIFPPAASPNPPTFIRSSSPLFQNIISNPQVPSHALPARQRQQGNNPLLPNIPAPSRSPLAGNDKGFRPSSSRDLRLPFSSNKVHFRIHGILGLTPTEPWNKRDEHSLLVGCNHSTEPRPSAQKVEGCMMFPEVMTDRNLKTPVTAWVAARSSLTMSILSEEDQIEFRFLVRSQSSTKEKVLCKGKISSQTLLKLRDAFDVPLNFLTPGVPQAILKASV
eukprot:GHVP01010892.1.p1 GENE.GHVP01010892.1~~GHVP01010892.1.p1  ORF type:complete len:1215 (+),score=190.40 GHVP01010892.1:1110-4754(+)